LITGGLTNVYRNMLTFDGGFSKYPYLNTTKPILHISPGLWQRNEIPAQRNEIPAQRKHVGESPIKKNDFMNGMDYTSLFSKDKFIFTEMCEQGYLDSNANRVKLDEIFRV
jgi:hypothetical protein